MIGSNGNQNMSFPEDKKLTSDIVVQKLLHIMVQVTCNRYQNELVVVAVLFTFFPEI